MKRLNDWLRGQPLQTAQCLFKLRTPLGSIYGSPSKALVAFTDVVKDAKDGQECTEAKMNGFPEAATGDRFEGDEYRFLIVASKFQTGFDQPKLVAMYVDKKLSGVACVQTLSCLNGVRVCH